MLFIGHVTTDKSNIDLTSKENYNHGFLNWCQKIGKMHQLKETKIRSVLVNCLDHWDGERAGEKCVAPASASASTLCRYVTMGWHMSASKVSLPWGSLPTSNTRFSGPTGVCFPPKCHLDQFCHFCTAHLCSLPDADTHSPCYLPCVKEIAASIQCVYAVWLKGIYIKRVP